MAELNKVETTENLRTKLKNMLKGSARVYLALAIIIVFSVLFSFKYFVKWDNIMNIVSNVALFGGFAAIGMTFVIILGGIDLSVAAMMAFAANMTCNFYIMSSNGEMSVSVAMVVMLVVVFVGAAIIGFINGILVTKRKLEPFIVTLGMMTVLYGLNKFITKGKTLNGVFDFFGNLGTGYFTWLDDGTFFVGPVTGEAAKMVQFKIPLVPIVFIIFAIVFVIILSKTIYGRHVYAIGGNAEAARLSGIRVDRTKIITYVICALLAAVNGILLASWTKSYSPNMTFGYELDVIAAVVIGGTLMAGGTGKLGGTIAGLFILTIIYNMLNLGIDLNVFGVDWYWVPDPYIKQLIKGIIILGAVIIQRQKPRK